MSKAATLGSMMKDFILKDQNGEPFALADNKGAKILLSFHPLAWTPVCAQQMKALEKNRRLFEAHDTTAVGVSIDSVPCKAAWARSLRIKHTRLLSDFWPHGHLADSLGLLRKEGFSERANILINEKGKIAFVKIYPIRELPDLEEIFSVLKTMP